jgi:hypothetical protein
MCASVTVSAADSSKSAQISLTLVNDVLSRRAATSPNTTSTFSDQGVKSYKDVALTALQPEVTSAQVHSDDVLG